MSGDELKAAREWMASRPPRVPTAAERAVLEEAVREYAAIFGDKATKTAVRRGLRRGSGPGRRRTAADAGVNAAIFENFKAELARNPATTAAQYARRHAPSYQMPDDLARELRRLQVKDAREAARAAESEHWLNDPAALLASLAADDEAD